MLEVYRTGRASDSLAVSESKSDSENASMSAYNSARGENAGDAINEGKLESSAQDSTASASNQKEKEEEAPWVEHLPASLKPLYMEQKNSLHSGLEAPSSLGTMPLKELVKTMHVRKFGNMTL